MISTVNKVARITRRTATTIDHMLSNAVINNEIPIGILKTHVFNNFPIFLSTTNGLQKGDKIEKPNFKRVITDFMIENFMQNLRSAHT